MGVLIHGWSESDPIGRTAAWLPSAICDHVDVFRVDVRLVPHLTRLRQTEVVKGLQLRHHHDRQAGMYVSVAQGKMASRAYPHRSLATKETAYATWACNSTANFHYSGRIDEKHEKTWKTEAPSPSRDS